MAFAGGFGGAGATPAAGAAQAPPQTATARVRTATFMRAGYCVLAGLARWGSREPQRAGQDGRARRAAGRGVPLVVGALVLGGEAGGAPRRDDLIRLRARDARIVRAGVHVQRPGDLGDVGNGGDRVQKRPVLV